MLEISALIVTGCAAALLAWLLLRERRLRVDGLRAAQTAHSRKIDELHTQLAATRDTADQALQARSRYLADMSHEIRTPMNGIIGFTDLLLESDLDETQRGQIQLIADSGRAMMQLLNDVLDHAKIEAGQLSLAPEPTVIGDQLRHCIALMEPMARAKGISLGMWVDEAVPDTVELDPLRMRQVLLNLIGNAVKFTPSGGIDVEARTENSSDGRFLLVSVIDTGVGIDESRLDTLFSPFAQEDISTSRHFGGTGLGLAISNQLVAMMGGRITVQSKRGVGTQFTVRLPLSLAKIPAASKKGPAHHSAMAAMTSLRGARVLIAEDHSVNQELIRTMAETLQLEARFVANGEDAVAAIVQAATQNEPYAAVLMDLRMPQMDGLEATRRLRAMGFDAETLPVIALTANCYPEDVEECKAAGMQSHLGKPVTAVALARELTRWLSPGQRQDGDLNDAFTATSTRSTPTNLRDRYRDRKSMLVGRLRQSLGEAPENTDWDGLAHQLHKMAGIAACFGEPELGEAARRLEHDLTTLHNPNDLLAALRREMPVFERASSAAYAFD